MAAGVSPSPKYAATPANPAESRPAMPTPTRSCAAYSAARLGAAAVATAPARASDPPQTMSGLTPSRSMRGPMASDATTAVPAMIERAWPTALTDAPRSRPISTTIGASTTMLAWVAMVARTSGSSRRGRGTPHRITGHLRPAALRGRPARPWLRDDLDPRAYARGPGEPRVEREQRHLQALGERDVQTVVEGDRRAQAPGSLEQPDVCGAMEWQLPQIRHGRLRGPGSDFT